MEKELDYLIVGQGLAGTFLAFQLLFAKKRFLVVDEGFENSASYIAAGIINPIVLKRLTITWRAEEFLQYNPSFYKRIESFLGSEYFYEKPLEKLISSSEEEQFWEHRYENSPLSDFIEKDLKNSDKSAYPTQNFKVGSVKQTSWLDIGRLLIDFRNT